MPIQSVYGFNCSTGRIVAGSDKVGQKVLYGALVGQAYARSGDAVKARNLLRRIDPLLNPQNDEQVAFFHLLEAEIAAASGGAASVVDLMKPPGPNDNNSAAILTCESLAWMNQRPAICLKPFAGTSNS